MKINNYLHKIGESTLFSCFLEEDLKRVLNSSHCFIKRYSRDEIIHFQNEECTSLDLILKGIVRVQNIDRDGNILTISDFAEGDSVGVNLLFSSRNKYPMNLLAYSDVILLHIDRKLILDMCQENKDFNIGIMRAISDRSIILSDKINTISLKTIREYIIDFLNEEYKKQNNKVIRLSSSKKDLAERWGIQRSSLSRELNKLRKEGLLEFDAQTITINWDINPKI